jgi:hemolysin III
MYLLYFMWLMCAVGVLLTAFYKRENRKWVLLAMYLTMGWSALICLPDLIHEFSSAGLNWILAGGLFYTTGVIFFVRDYHLDHMVWHLFVFAGSACHWWCIYKYLVTPGALELQAQYPSANFPISLIKMKIQNHVA